MVKILILCKFGSFVLRAKKVKKAQAAACQNLRAATRRTWHFSGCFLVRVVVHFGDQLRATLHL